MGGPNQGRKVFTSFYGANSSSVTSGARSAYTQLLHSATHCKAVLETVGFDGSSVRWNVCSACALCSS